MKRRWRKMKTAAGVKKGLIKMLKASGKQFYNEKGKKITVESYVELLLKQKLSDLNKYKKKLVTFLLCLPKDIKLPSE